MTEMVDLLKSGTVQPEGIIATTFTKKAAAELEERVRICLLEEGLPELADRLTGALIGTVHGLGVKLLKRFAFEAGVSPDASIMADEDQDIFFNQSLSTILTEERVNRMEYLTERLALRKADMKYDWRRDVKDIIDRARANGFDRERLEEGMTKSYEELEAFFPKPLKIDPEEFEKKFRKVLEDAISSIKGNEADGTKATRDALSFLEQILVKYKQGNLPTWEERAKISKLKVGAKSRDIVDELKTAARNHSQHPDFLKELKEFLDGVYQTAIDAIDEYGKFKKKRGLIDYIDMETRVKELLNNQEVAAVLSDEIDLLMVDEFQDTSPIQLEIFFRLTKMANHSIWVGDPKQSIYGFRGAEPELMMGIIEQTGGIRPQDIQKFSWRSREDLVHASNAIFCQAFHETPEEQVALIPKRRHKAGPETANKVDEPIEVGTAIHHWHFIPEDGGKRTGRPWMDKCIASTIRGFLERKPYVNVKGSSEFRPAKPGDVAILCRSNKHCLEMAEALHHQGLKAAISRNGLLGTPEAKLVLSCLKYLTYRHDSLSVAEIMFLASSQGLEDIMDNRIRGMEKDNFKRSGWADSNEFVERLDELRPEITELSGAEILNLILEDLDIRRIVTAWGNPEQRINNIDMLRHYAERYEDACNRLNTGASLPGYLLWLNDLAANENDAQGFSMREDAVNVLTYHKSKGLEWPVVVMHSLENQLRDNLFGANVISQNEELDLDNLSAGRYIRYWRHPYGKQYKSTALEETLATADVRLESIKQAAKEEARLMYVGITRARDYMVLVSRMGNSPKWLDRVCNTGKEEIAPVLNPDTPESPWIWKGNVLPMVSEVLPFPKILEHHPITVGQLSTQEERNGFNIHQRLFLQGEDLKLNGNSGGIQTGSPLHYGNPVKIGEDVEEYPVAKALCSYLNFDVPEYSDASRQQAAERILGNFELEEGVDKNDFILNSKQFHDWLQAFNNSVPILKCYPLAYQEGGRKFRGEMDVLMDTGEEIIAVRHTSFPGSVKKWRSKIRDNAGRFKLLWNALHHSFPDRKIRLYEHFVLSGGVMEVSF